MGDEDEIGVTLAGYYTTAAFAPTATDLSTGKYEGSAAVSYLFDFEDFEATTGTLKYTYRAITATNAVDKSEIKATMEFTIEGTETAKLEGIYRLDTGNIVAYGDYLNYPFDDDEEWKLSAIAKYNLQGWDVSGAAEYYGILTLDHAYSDTTSFQLEGRWDSTPAAGAPNYSAYAEVKHTLAENTTLKVYYELNDWDVDEDWATTIGVNDGIGTLWSRLEVTF